MKVVYSPRYGGFGLSEKAIKLFIPKLGVSKFSIDEGDNGVIPEEEYNNLNPIDKGMFISDPNEGGDYWLDIYNIPRHHPILVAVVEELGSKEASSRYADLQIHNTTEGKYYIDEYDGLECVVEPHTIEWIEIDTEELKKYYVEYML